MKLIRFIALTLFMALMSSSCSHLQNSLGAATSSPASPPVSTTPTATTTPPTLHPPQSFTEPDRFGKRDEFHNAVIDYKNSYSTQMHENATEFHTFENLDWYYDFKNPVEDVELGEIQVMNTYVALDYWDYEDDTHGSLLIQTWREGVTESKKYTEESYLDMLRTNSGGSDYQINGKRVIKEEVYWDNDYYDNYYVCNQYRWIEDGYYVFMRVPPWLLELYPEETFFDIEKVEIPKEKVDAGLAE